MAMNRTKKEKQPIKTGALVCLKSGGPVMTVSCAGFGASSDIVQCSWFDTHKEQVFQSLFHPDALNIAELAEPARKVRP